ncbi:MAG: septum formation protein Maf [Ruminococcus sp.]|nr:septum formation protein Maf [Ruminococcus sp.]
MRKIILASASPRRQELLKDIVPDFEVVVSKVQEVVPKGVGIYDAPKFLALLKARDVSKAYPDSIVIGSDTVVVVDDKVLNKPKDENDAFEMLRLLSGRKHKVITGCALVCGDKELSFCVSTEVEFYELTDKEILDYIATKDPLDKAGAYGIQSGGKTLVKAIYGDFYNVVGLPVGVLKRELVKFMD